MSPVPVSVVVALCAIVFVAFVSEASIGFGATVITVTLAVLLVPLTTILPAFVPINMVLSAYLVLRHRRHVAWRVLVTELAPAMGIGLAGGLVVFRFGKLEALKLAFAIFVVALSTFELSRRPDAKVGALAPGVRHGLLGLGGFVHGLFGTGGPMIVYVLQRRGLDKGAFRVTLAVVWLSLNTALLINYASLGLLGAGSARLSLLLALSLVPGVLVGELLHDRLSPRRFQLGIFTLLLAAGLALAVRTALQLGAPA